MICVDYPCFNCKHIRDNIHTQEGIKCACDAFIDGIPVDNLLYKSVEELKECNNGIGYVPKEA